MSVTLELHLYMKPGEELDEGRPVTPAELLSLGDALHERLDHAAQALEVLGKRGWENQMSLYSVILYDSEGLASTAEAAALLRELELDPNYFTINDDDEEEEDNS